MKMMMGKMWAWMLLTIFLTSIGQWHGHCHGCLEEERNGLLSIKALIDPNNVQWKLSDWTVNQEDMTDCCAWYGVGCDNTTRRVVQLSLSDARDKRLGDWLLNASLFLPFEELQSLDLSANRLVGCFENQGFRVPSSKLRRLDVLDLSFNPFNDDSILSCLTGLLSLKSLDLSANRLEGSAGFNGFEALSSRLKKLEHLNLYNESIFFHLQQGFEVLSSRLKKLENLHLSGNQYNDSIFSSLTGFSSLKSLDLSRNNLTGSTSTNASQFRPMWRLRKLENLDLSFNKLNDNVLSILSGLSSLKSLDLSYNKLTGSSINGLEIVSSQLRKLENLDLSYNKLNDNVLSNLCGFPSLKSLNLSGNILLRSTTISGLRKLEVLSLDKLTIIGSTLLQSLGALPSLKTLSVQETTLTRASISQGTFFNSTILEELYLDHTSLPINFLQNIGPLPALKVLSVGECDLNGTLPAQGWWCELKNLEQLDLSGNNLEGSVPECLGNLSSLQLLDVSGNRFSGNIASSPLTNIISLEFLSLSNNHFEVPVSMKPFMNHSSLKFFSSENNRLVAGPAAFHNLIPKFQLVYFSLSDSSTSEALNLDISSFLYNQHNLRFLDLSGNNFNGMFPSWLLRNNTRLEQLFLGENSFVGTLQVQDHPNPHMTILDISNNNLSGQFPKHICLMFPNLVTLRMPKNGLIGCIPSCLGNISSLEDLDLSSNQLSSVKLEQFTTLTFLDLSKNNLGGQLPASVVNFTTLNYLCLSFNNFRGQIADFPTPVKKKWAALGLSNNQFSGMLPRWFANSTRLRTLDLSRNQFKGPIPIDFCKLDGLKYLDLSENKLFGSIPSCFNPPNITHVHLSRNRLSGPLTYGFHNSSSLVTLDLRDNSFTGAIPNWFGNLSTLNVLLLRANHFDGEFPVQLCLLEQLSILDVSQNQLSGPLPSCLGNLTFKESSKKAVVYLGIVFSSRSIGKAYYETMGPPLVESIYNLDSSYLPITIEEVVEFATKSMYYSYKGKVLSFMSGIDLSSNNFSGAIPPKLGNLNELHALNLSHNNLTGSIPATFSSLKQIESLDLSYNNLNGVIPPQLTEMTTLEVFSVAHNNLSGKTPERKYQFGTFDESSYEGNPFLYGPPLPNNCSEEESPLQPMPNDEQEDDCFIDMDFFYISFSGSYIIVLMAISAVLYINPYWRRRWFYFIEDCIDTCYCFLLSSFRKLSNFRR